MYGSVYRRVYEISVARRIRFQSAGGQFFSEPYGQQLFSRLCTERANRDRRIVHRNEKPMDSRNGILYRPVLRKSRRGVPSGNVAVGEETNIVNTGRETSGERAARFYFSGRIKFFETRLPDAPDEFISAARCGCGEERADGSLTEKSGSRKRRKGGGPNGTVVCRFYITKSKIRYFMIPII
mgnify:CR=1 FL=1